MDYMHCASICTYFTVTSTTKNAGAVDAESTHTITSSVGEATTAKEKDNEKKLHLNTNIQLLREIGEIIAYDAFINNVDRIPAGRAYV